MEQIIWSVACLLVFLRKKFSMKSVSLSLFILVSAAVTACSPSANADRRGNIPADSTAEALQLALPALPDTLVEPEARAAYLLMHFWDAMDWRDDKLVDSEDFMEQNAANFYDLFRLTDSLTASAATARMLEAAAVSPKAYRVVAEIAEKYLYDPNSPMLNEESYLIVTDRLVADNHLDEGEMVRLADRRRRMLLNRVGTEAADFVLTDRAGKSLSLSEIVSRRPYTVVMFYDTDCEDCKEVEHRLMTTLELGDGIAAGLLSFVAVSPFEVEANEWSAQASAFSGEWTVGYSPEGRVDADEIYDIRATPSIYVIGRDGRVMAKDVRAENLREWIAYQLQQHN